MATTNKIPIGLNLPIRNGPSGYFDQSTDSFTAIRMNIINLLRTIPGERRMNPTLGCRLWNLVFEQNDPILEDKIRNTIKEDISRWIPEVSVKTIEVKYYADDESVELRDIYKLYIVVKFIVNSIKVDDVVELTLNINKV